MPLLGPIDAPRVKDRITAKVEVAVRINLKDPVLTLDYVPGGLFEIYKGPDRVWAGTDLDEAVALYNQYAGFSKPASNDDFDFI